MGYSELYNLVVPSAEEASFMLDVILFAFFLTFELFSILVLLFIAVGFLLFLWDFVKSIPGWFRNRRSFFKSFHHKKNRP